MIVRSRPLKLAAVLLAGGAHAALAVALVPQVEVRTEGGAGAQDVRLGTSFADMAAGTLAAAPAEPLEHDQTPDEPPLQPVTPTDQAPRATADPLVPDTPKASHKARPDPAALQAAPPKETAARVDVVKSPMSPPGMALAAVLPVGALPLAPQDNADRAEPVQSATAHQRELSLYSAQ